MSEYQRYEFMTCDRPLIRAQLDEVNSLSSHIEASSTHALIEYNYGDFKHDPIRVLQDFFDGFLYWANWGSPQFALRFPHGVLPANLLAGYDFDDLVTFTQHKNYDILNIEFGEMEGPDEWIEYELSDLIAIRDELMAGDLRALYIAWLAVCPMLEDGDDEDEDEESEDGDEQDEEGEEDEDNDVNNKREQGNIGIPPVPSAFGKLTAAQQALAELLQVSDELLEAAARHSSQTAMPTAKDDFAAWIQLLSPERKSKYLLRLANNEPGLSRFLITELRELNPHKTRVLLPEGERVSYAKLLAESRAVKAQLAREKRAKEEAARIRRLQDVHTHQDTFWGQVNSAATRGTSTGYNEALQGLVELRDAAKQFNEVETFQERFQRWVQSHLRRPALLKRLREHHFPLPEA